MDLSQQPLIGVVATNSVDFVRRVFDAYDAGQVVVLLKEEGPEAVLHGVQLSDVVHPEAGGGWLDVPHQPRDDDAPAQIAFTSGTTGAPKAVALSHRALADVVRRLNSVMEVTDEIREYVGVPVTYSFGLGRCRAVAAAGGKCFLPEGGFNPAEIAAMLKRGEINAISAVPTLWRTLFDMPEVIGRAGELVRWIEIGSQYMSREEKERMKALFPNARIVQHYGLTEASRTTFLVISEAEGDALDSVGRPVGDTRVEIGDSGRVRIAGPHLATWQWSAGKAEPIAGADGWLETNDLGELRDGLLYFGGRADDLINCGGVKLHPDDLERRIAAAAPTGVDFAVCRVPDVMRGDGIFVGVASPDPDLVHRLQEVARDQALVLGVNARSSVRAQSVTSIPRTDTGKPRRKELANAYVPPEASGAAPRREDALENLFVQVFPSEQVTEESSFTSLGGDSLNYVKMSVLLESELGSLPAGWENMSIAQLRTFRGKGDQVSRIETNVLLRAAAITVAVAGHSHLPVAGGAIFLLMLVGFNLARFQAPRLIDGQVWSTLWHYARKVVYGYWALSIGWLLYKQAWEPEHVLLVANLVEGESTEIIYGWFIQVLVQCLVILGVMFSLPPVRTLLHRYRWFTSIAIMIGFIGARVVVPKLWDASHLWGQVPHMLMPMLWLGWCVRVSERTYQKLAVTVLGLLVARLHSGWYGVATGIAVGAPLLMFVPTLRMPRTLRSVFEAVGAASFHLYLSHLIFIQFPLNVWQLGSPWINFAFGMGGGMLTWWLVEIAELPRRALEAARDKGFFPRSARSVS